MLQLRRILNASFESLLPIVGVIFALMIGAIMLLALNADPLSAYAALIEGAFGSTYSFMQSLVKATPLLLVGLGVCIAFRGGVINIGGEGQIIVGGLAATALALSLNTLPGILSLIIALLGGIVAGAIWGGVPGILKAQLGVNEILSTIMMNAIAQQLSNFLLRGPMIDPKEIVAKTFLPQSAQVPDYAWLPRLLPPTLLHFGTVLAIIMAILVYILLWRTVIGYRIRAVGLNPSAAKYAGINVPRYQALALILGGAFAGLAGSVEVMGVTHRMMDGVSGGYGFTGIVAALFGKLHPLGTIPASVLFGALLVGADKMQRAVQVPSSLIEAMLGLVVLFVVSSEIWVRYRARQRQIKQIEK
jgi:simple sugar transport system permease protein